MKYITAIVFITQFLSGLYAQKEAYIPLYLLDQSTVDGQQFTWSKTLQSDNFTLIWGDAAGENPLLSTDPDLVFNPAAVLDTMEAIYAEFLALGFASEVPGNQLSQYKIPIIMLNTFGPGGAEGWAFGGDVDGVIGAFWAHPLSMQAGNVAAHELTHSLQAQAVIDNRLPANLGGAWDNCGIFWETHANFMRNLIYPENAFTDGMDIFGMESFGQWKNTYENYHLLFAILEEDGIEIINRLWQEAYSYEYPIAAYKRLMNYSQQELNDKLFRYARRMAGLDFPLNNLEYYLRANRTANLSSYLPVVQSVYTLLEQDSLVESIFRVPIELAPEEYGYNLIPIYPNTDSCAVIVKFKGHTETNPYTGWRYGFVSTLNDGSIGRYSETFSANEASIGFSLLPGEENLFLVVMGAPELITTDIHHDTWKGYPKRYRFPYELTISGAVPEGFQPPNEFRSSWKTDGHIHSFGGGWVSNSSTVDPSVYVAPHAMVLGNSHISGVSALLNTAIVVDADISDQVVISDNALVLGGSLSENARVSGQAFSENNTVYGNARIDMRARVSNYELHGTIHVGGDVIVYNSSGNCDNGTYFRMTNYYEDNLLECDNRDETHPNNQDVNAVLERFTTAQMESICYCENYPECLTLSLVEETTYSDELLVYPNPAHHQLNVEFKKSAYSLREISLFNMLGAEVFRIHSSDASLLLDLSNLPGGIYLMRVSGQQGQQFKRLELLK